MGMFYEVVIDPSRNPLENVCSLFRSFFETSRVERERSDDVELIACSDLLVALLLIVTACCVKGIYYLFALVLLTCY